MRPGFRDCAELRTPAVGQGAASGSEAMVRCGIAPRPQRPQCAAVSPAKKAPRRKTHQSPAAQRRKRRRDHELAQSRRGGLVGLLSVRLPFDSSHRGCSEHNNLEAGGGVLFGLGGAARRVKREGCGAEKRQIAELGWVQRCYAVKRWCEEQAGKWDGRGSVRAAHRAALAARACA